MDVILDWKDDCELIHLQDPLLGHYHPSVQHYMVKLMSADNDITSEVSLTVHSLISFLDRFVYRQPKKSVGSLRGASMMQPLAAAEGADMLISATSRTHKKLPPVNSSIHNPSKSESIRPEEVFFHKYFDTRDRTTPREQKRPSLKASNSVAEGEEHLREEDEQVWKALVESRPDLEVDEGNDLESISDDMEYSLSEDEDQAPADGDVDGVGEFGEEKEEIWASDDEVPAVTKMLDVAEDASSRQGGDRKALTSKQSKRRMLKDLPTFASADEYAKMLEEDDPSSC